MPTLTILQGQTHTAVEMPSGATLLEGLRLGGFPHVDAPCGGKGRCGRCLVEVSGQTVNLMTAVSLVMLAAFTAYAVDVIGKLKDMLLTATPGTDQTPAALPEEKTDEAPDAPKEE